MAKEITKSEVWGAITSVIAHKRSSRRVPLAATALEVAQQLSISTTKVQALASELIADGALHLGRTINYNLYTTS